MSKAVGSRGLKSKYREYIRPHLPDRFHRYLQRTYYGIYPHQLSEKEREKERRLTRERREKILEGVPNSLPEKHIDNIKVLSDRASLLNHLPENGLVAELGVDLGEFSEEILSRSHPNKLYLVDVWEGGRYNEVKEKRLEKNSGVKQKRTS
ncbi:hypothetical protein [Salinibacter ruber]|uniref:hypothetical protein n=1 Tax=Salinibacter ruber TaxID=146919 RepID=UPI0020730F46|nr:hypothetical protein [Salinibacter ruber]MCS4116156.1 hypothetical protein [Salinibacter ruber]MCS4181667.1 hypothetical protein [Salinibacter ruber]